MVNNGWQLIGLIGQAQLLRLGSNALAVRRFLSIRRNERLPEMSRALERWGAKLEAIVTGEGGTRVVAFKR